MARNAGTVVIIDSDASFCSGTECLVRSAGIEARVLAFRAPLDFLCGRRPDVPACIVLEVRLPGLSGLDVQRKLAGSGSGIPLIFVTQHGDVATAVQALKAGALDFLTKPVHGQQLLEDIKQALERDQAVYEQQRHLAELREDYETLTPSQREVMAGVASGLLNKQIGAELGITEKTVKFHRGHVMRKMGANSAVDLVRMAERLGLVLPGFRGAWIGGPKHPNSQQFHPSAVQLFRPPITSGLRPDSSDSREAARQR